jgi:hypothetical protein
MLFTFGLSIHHASLESNDSRKGLFLPMMECIANRLPKAKSKNQNVKGSNCKRHDAFHSLKTTKETGDRQ